MGLEVRREVWAGNTDSGVSRVWMGSNARRWDDIQGVTGAREEDAQALSPKNTRAETSGT